MGAAAPEGTERTVRGEGQYLLLPHPVALRTCTGAGTGVGTGLLQTVDEPVCLQLQVLHQLQGWGVVRVSSSPPQEPEHLAKGSPSQQRGRRGRAAHLPECVKLGPLGYAVLARLVLTDEVVVHGFPIDQRQRVRALLFPGPQPGGDKEGRSPL